ncbi:MAG: hypothetical protein JRI80_19155 [Deltaproteobacteria bacterium]|nr:hypothetical protein [Deltaproteobacteria bacterium]
MSWQSLPLCFELLSPLHIGFLPNRPGTFQAPTRCYVPGKNMWGAATAALTPRMCKSLTARHFAEVGDAIKRQMIFSYLYLSDGKEIFMPDYDKEGLRWGDCNDREFRARFLDSIVSTEIVTTGAAKDTSLHEIEFIRHRIGSPGEPNKPVLLVGKVWLSEGGKIFNEQLEIRNDSIVVKDIDVFEGITLGGEQNYGFGLLQKTNVPEFSDSGTNVNEILNISPGKKIRIERNKPLIGHLPYRPDKLFVGEIEILAGREYLRDDSAVKFAYPGKSIVNTVYCFVPGTRVKAGNAEMDFWGRLHWTDSECKHSSS